MEMRRLLIADASEEFVSALTEQLREKCHIRFCGNGYQALEQLRSYQPDILAVDLMLPELDGISLLQAAADAGILPQVLAMTRFVSPYVLDAMERFRVSYLMMKPCSIAAAAERIMDLTMLSHTPQTTKPDMRSTVSNLLIAMGMPTKLRGYCCTREAILSMMHDPGMSITKELYPKVAGLCDGTAAQVERAIRGAIGAAWHARDELVWKRFFQTGIDGTIRRPTNAEFISRLADQLALEKSNLWENVEQGYNSDKTIVEI